MASSHATTLGACTSTSGSTSSSTAGSGGISGATSSSAGIRSDVNGGSSWALSTRGQCVTVFSSLVARIALQDARATLLSHAHHYQSIPTEAVLPHAAATTGSGTGTGITASSSVGSGIDAHDAAGVEGLGSVLLAALCRGAGCLATGYAGLTSTTTTNDRSGTMDGGNPRSSSSATGCSLSIRFSAASLSAWGADGRCIVASITAHPQPDAPSSASARTTAAAPALAAAPVAEAAVSTRMWTLVLESTDE